MNYVNGELLGAVQMSFDQLCFNILTLLASTLHHLRAF